MSTRYFKLKECYKCDQLLGYTNAELAHELITIFDSLHSKFLLVTRDQKLRYVSNYLSSPVHSCVVFLDPTMTCYGDKLRNQSNGQLPSIIVDMYLQCKNSLYSNRIHTKEKHVEILAQALDTSIIDV